jgi:hypothetical protein
MSIRGILPGKLDVMTKMPDGRVEIGSSFIHEVWLGSIINPAELPYSNLTCHLRATPKGWASLGSTDAEEKVVKRNLDWRAPAEGRRGINSRYIAVARVTTTKVLITRDPPSKHGGRQQAEVQTAFPIDGEAACLVHDLFWIEL